MTEPLDPALAAFLSRNTDVARRLANMAPVDRDAAFERIRRWIDHQSNAAPVTGREGFTAIMEALT